MRRRRTDLEPSPQPRRSRRLPSPALVVAALALLVALAGTSYAAVALEPGSVGTLQSWFLQARAFCANVP